MSRQPASVAVIIPCHNYARFLAECLESVLSQVVRPKEIIVVDDASTDDPKAIVDQFPGVRYIRHEAKDVFRTRALGFASAITNPEYVIFLDADDTLDTDYIDRCLSVFSEHEDIGIVTTNVTRFGSRSGAMCFREVNLEHMNYVHAGSMVRSNALIVTEAFNQDSPDTNSHADWFVWRRLVQFGWKIGRVDKPCYNYRQHPESMMHKRNSEGNYYAEANLSSEPITLVIPVSGRERYFSRLENWITRAVQGQKVAEVVIVDSARNTQFSDRVKALLFRLNGSVRYVPVAKTGRLADQDRSQIAEAYRAVQVVMPRLYQVLRHVSTEYILILEDDVLPPDPLVSVEQLKREMRVDVAAVAGIMESRYQHGYSISHDTSQRTHKLKELPISGTLSVGGTGFGYLLLRKSVLMAAPPLSNGGRTQNYDVEFARQVRQLGWKWMLNCDIRCAHGDKPAP